MNKIRPMIIAAGILTIFSIAGLSVASAQPSQEQVRIERSVFIPVEKPTAVTRTVLI